MLCHGPAPREIGTARTTHEDWYKGMTQHLTDDTLVGFIGGVVDLTDEEQNHMSDCEVCNDRFRSLLISSGNGDDP